MRELRNTSEPNAAMLHVYSQDVLPLRGLQQISDEYSIGVVDSAHKARAGLCRGGPGNPQACRSDEGTLERIIRQRMADAGSPDVVSYQKGVESTPEEWEELLEAVVVGQNWFFRDGEPIAFLSDFARTDWWPKHGNRLLRVLSIPCATGEEPYSIEITLLEAVLTPRHFLIDAVDISSKALNKARTAVYGKILSAEKTWRFAGAGLRHREIGTGCSILSRTASAFISETFPTACLILIRRPMRSSFAAICLPGGTQEHQQMTAADAGPGSALVAEKRLRGARNRGGVDSHPPSWLSSCQSAFSRACEGTLSFTWAC